MPRCQHSHCQTVFASIQPDSHLSLFEIVYSKRFAQSAGPGFRSSKFCTVPHIFLPKMFKKQDGMLAFFGAFFESFFHLRGYFEAFFGPWGHSWGTMGSFLRSKNGLGHQTYPKTAPRGATLVSVSPFLGHFGGIFSYFFDFSAEKESF